MGKSQRIKGASWERDLATQCSISWQIEVKRGIGQARSSSEVPDVDAPGLWIEAKCHSDKPSIFAALEQAETASAKTTRVPVAVCKWTHHGVVVAWRWRHETSGWCEGWHRFAVPSRRIAMSCAWDLLSHTMRVEDVAIAPLALWLACEHVRSHVVASNKRSELRLVAQ